MNKRKHRILYVTYFLGTLFVEHDSIMRCKKLMKLTEAPMLIQKLLCSTCLNEQSKETGKPKPRAGTQPAALYRSFVNNRAPRPSDYNDVSPQSKQPFLNLIQLNK